MVGLFQQWPIAPPRFGVESVISQAAQEICACSRPSAERGRGAAPETRLRSAWHQPEFGARGAARFSTASAMSRGERDGESWSPLPRAAARACSTKACCSKRLRSRMPCARILRRHAPNLPPASHGRRDDLNWNGRSPRSKRRRAQDLAAARARTTRFTGSCWRAQEQSAARRHVQSGASGETLERVARAQELL